MSYVSRLTKSQHRDLAKKLHLGDYEDSIIATSPEGVDHLFLSVHNATVDGLDATFVFSDHGISDCFLDPLETITAYFDTADMNDEEDGELDISSSDYRAYTENPQSTAITQAFILAMSELFPDYLKAETQYRTKTISVMAEAIKSNMNVVDNLQNTRTSVLKKSDNLIDEAYEKCVDQSISITKYTEALKQHIISQYNEAGYHDFMLSFCFERQGMNPEDRPQPLKPLKIQNYVPLINFIPLSVDPDEMDDEDSDEDEDYSYEFENNPGLEDCLPKDFEDNDENSKY